METVVVDRAALADLVRLSRELQERVESLELANDSEVMDGLKRSRDEIEKGDLVNFDEL